MCQVAFYAMRIIFFAFMLIYSDCESRASANQKVQSELSAHFAKYDANSRQTLNFKNLDALLNKYVWKTGRSNRKYAFRPWVRIERIIRGNPYPTRLEANRLFYHILTSHDIAVITALLDYFQKLPNTVALSTLNRKEQLAYWVNLHNLAIISLVAQNYPVVKVGQLYAENADRKFLRVEQFDLSLNDIRYRILAPLWHDPLIVYGLYYGAVGGPNIRTKAFYGATVYKQLEENAREFVNSLRGVRFRRDTLLISQFFLWNEPFFNGAETGIRKHLERFAEGEVAERMIQYNKVEYAKFDWFIADLFNGRHPKPLGSGIVPPLVAELLQNVQDRNRLREATVEIEEYVTDTEQ